MEWGACIIKTWETCEKVKLYMWEIICEEKHVRFNTENTADKGTDSFITFMHLADAFIQSDLLWILFRLYIFFFFFISMCVPWELNPRPFALLTQCSTTEPKEHYAFIKRARCKNAYFAAVMENSKYHNSAIWNVNTWLVKKLLTKLKLNAKLLKSSLMHKSSIDFSNARFLFKYLL